MIVTCILFQISKGTPIVTVSTAICKDEEILLNYAPNPDLSITTLPSDAYPHWLKEAAKQRAKIPVFLYETDIGHVCFIAPEHEHPIPLKSVSLTHEEKLALLSTVSSVTSDGCATSQPVSRSLSMSTEQKMKLLNSVTSVSAAESQNTLLPRASSSVTVGLEKSSSSNTKVINK